MDNHLKKDRRWTVLLVGGASGTGKSSFAYALARHYGINVLEFDDINQALKAMTTKEECPATHYWNNGIDWMDIGVSGNVKWLIDVSREMIPALKAIIKRHLEDDVPDIIEGDFIHPEIIKNFDNAEVKSLFVLEQDKEQLLQNFLDREGGDLQHYRTDISIEYGEWQIEICGELGISVIESKPWDTCVSERVDAL